MIDRELLELAAKAIGQEVVRWNDTGDAALLAGVQEPWNPLTDDGDALRLAVMLQIWLRYRDDNTVHACWYDDKGLFAGNVTEEFGSLRNGDDAHASTRRAIVRAAAEIGRAMS